MPCRQLAEYNGRAGRQRLVEQTPSGPVFAPFRTEAECNQACGDGACCEGANCSVKPKCQCQGTGKVFQGVGTVCTPNPCECYCGSTSATAMPNSLYVVFSGGTIWDQVAVLNRLPGSSRGSWLDAMDSVGFNRTALLAFSGASNYSACHSYYTIFSSGKSDNCPPLSFMSRGGDFSLWTKDANATGFIILALTGYSDPGRITPGIGFLSVVLPARQPSGSPCCFSVNGGKTITNSLFGSGLCDGSLSISFNNLGLSLSGTGTPPTTINCGPLASYPTEPTVRLHA